MTLHLQRDLDALKKGLLELSTLVEEGILRAIRALVDRRAELAEEVIAGDKEIDRREVALEEDCLKILALHQPVAIDLRFIVAVLKVNNELERMGDLAVNIAERAAFLSSQEPIRIPGDLAVMAGKVREMVLNSLRAVVEMDTDLARKVLETDDEVDEIHKEMFEVVQDLIEKDPRMVRRGIHYLSVSRYLERIADQTTNIAEDLIFMVNGTVVRHEGGGWDRGRRKGS